MNLPSIEWDSRSLLLDQLSKTERSILIGGDIESPSSFFSCRVTSCAGYVEIGVISNQPRGFVGFELLPDGTLLLIGHDQAFTVVNIAKVDVHLNEQLDGVFFEFLVDEPRHQVLAIHELGVVVLSFEGHVKWRYSSSDILEDWRIIGDSIRLSAMDEASVLVNLTTGTQVHSQS